MTIRNLTERILSWRRYRQSIRELSRLSDRELADLGINRLEIASIARKSLAA